MSTPTDSKILVPNVRMYVDENGHQSLKGDLSSRDKRFLCMTGVIMPISEHDTTLTSMINDLKTKYFGSEDIILHRRELISAKGCFAPLSDDHVRSMFNDDLLHIIDAVNYKVISIVIDKLKLVDTYGLTFAQDPYSLALEFLMQRYLYWMQDCQSIKRYYYGDILAESRGGGEDMITKRTYHDIYLGKGCHPINNACNYFSSSQIKLKRKSDNIPGLQFVDLISHPARRYILSENGLAPDIKSSSFEQAIVQILQERKFRKKNERIDGVGTVLYPK